MGTLTLKQLCDAAREEIGFSKPGTYAGSSDPDGLQTHRLANRQGISLLDEHVYWEFLKKEGSITLIAADQDYALASDFRYLIPSTSWDGTNDRLAVGPLTPMEWAFNQKSGIVFGLSWRWEIRGGEFVLDQTVTSADAGTVISYEYISKYWVTATGGSEPTKAAFSVDTDTQSFDDDLFVEGLIWRLKRSKGFDWQEDFALYQNHLNKIKSRDGGMRDIDMLNKPALSVNIPEGSFVGG